MLLISAVGQSFGEPQGRELADTTSFSRVVYF